jgi:Na+/phosphate symporter
LLEKNYWKEITVPSTTLKFLIKIIQATQSNDGDRSEGIKALKKEIGELDESVQEYYTDLLNLLSLKKGMSSLSLPMINFM